MIRQPITITEAKKFLRLEYNDDDAFIGSLIATAREVCENFLREQINPDALPESVKQAMLLVVAYYYENRDTADANGIPRAVYQLLNPYRKVVW